MQQFLDIDITQLQLSRLPSSGPPSFSRLLQSVGQCEPTQGKLPVGLEDAGKVRVSNAGATYQLKRGFQRQSSPWC